ncbi:MAG TPA: hypothetical protein VG456_07620 [Candidatus Sulfopaludibacter sp.]|jgi:hypothetical protein|nr:hypothetical protein [Candidatus Sulfopaludibacter sp.]
MNRTLLAGLLGGVAMFAWASIAHMALPLGGTGISEIPGEPAVLNSMQAALGSNAGMYMFPAMPSDSDMKVYGQKLAVNPSGILIYRPPGATMLEPSQLIIEFLTETLEALIAVWLLTQTRIYSFGARVGFFAVIGILCSLGTNVSYWNWYGYPGSYTLVYMMIQIVEFLVAGVVAASLLRKTA